MQTSWDGFCVRGRTWRLWPDHWEAPIATGNHQIEQRNQHPAGLESTGLQRLDRACPRWHWEFGAKSTTIVISVIKERIISKFPRKIRKCQADWTSKTLFDNSECHSRAFTEVGASCRLPGLFLAADWGLNLYLQRVILGSTLFSKRLAKLNRVITIWFWCYSSHMQYTMWCARKCASRYRFWSKVSVKAVRLY